MLIEQFSVQTTAQHFSGSTRLSAELVELVHQSEICGQAEEHHLCSINQIMPLVVRKLGLLFELTDELVVLLAPTRDDIGQKLQKRASVA